MFQKWHSKKSYRKSVKFSGISLLGFMQRELRDIHRMNTVRIVLIFIGFAAVFLLVFDVKLKGATTNNFYCGRSVPAFIDPAEEARVLKNQKHRQKQLSDTCARFNSIMPTMNFTKWKFHSRYNWILNDRLRYMYCETAKVARTSWKRTLLMFTGRMRVNRSTDLSRTTVHDIGFADAYLDRHQHFTPDEFKTRVGTHFKFMFVRHPFERLVSGYRDFVQRVGYNAKDDRRDNWLTSRSDRKWTFEEFVEYLLDPSTPQPFNEHWLQYYRACFPCQIQYDFIGKFETLQEDAAYVIRRLGGGVEFPTSDPENTWKKSAEIVESMKKNISTESFNKLRELYALDYALFDYE